MQFSVVLLSAITAIILAHPNIYNQCQPQFFNPLNYLDQLPSLKMPYVNNVPIPNIPLAHIIKPTPAITTKVINVVTKYVARNPVCIKSTGKKKPPCKKDSVGSNTTATKKYSNDHIITKEYFVNNRVSKSSRAQLEEEQYKKIKDEINAYKNLKDVGTRPENVHIHGSETPSYHRIARDVALGGHLQSDVNDEDEEVNEATPELHARKLIKPSAEKMNDLLIEDRLDRLEDMLPHYTRMRVYQTSTITVTRTRTARMATATLMVKNCVPDGIDYCKKRQKTTTNTTNKKKKKKTNKRKSKVAVPQSPTIPNYNQFYYG